MRTREEQYDVGVLVARFQVHELHEGHRALLDHVVATHSKVLLVLGLAPVLNTQNNPLDYPARRQMILENYPDVDVAFIKDVNNDELWSRRLDQVIDSHKTPRQTAVVYGGRDSFIEHYSGRYDTREMVQDVWYSGTATRDKIARSATIASPEFRAGVIWAAYSRFPTAYPTIDAAVFNEDFSAVLLGKRDHEPAYRFIGGFVEPKSESLEANVRREVREEAGIEVSDLFYICSVTVDDWRYRNEVDGIMTTLFGARYVFGKPTPGDDIDEVRWFDLDKLRQRDVVPAHWVLLTYTKDASLRKRGATHGPIDPDPDTNKGVGT